MNSAIIVAAGKGTRMGPDIDKLFIEVAGVPVVVHAWRAFERVQEIGHVVVVVRAGMEDSFRELASEWGMKKPFSLVAGGRERQDSVWNGCEALPPETEIVAIQDGARPCTSAAVIRATLQAAREHGAAVAAQRMVDTVKESSDGAFIQKHLDRSKLFSVQTPQTFRVEVIREALAHTRRKGLLVTDDTAACEMIGHAVKLVLSSDPNPKVTTREDVPYVDFLLRNPLPRPAG
jgi:2-C-methyl-D-erythritol 4-phosphate cytidylyltransferase